MFCNSSACDFINFSSIVPSVKKRYLINTKIKLFHALWMVLIVF